MEKFVKNSLTAAYDEFKITPQFSYSVNHQCDHYEVYSGGALQGKYDSIEEIVEIFKDWTEEDLKSIEIDKITLSRVTLLR